MKRSCFCCRELLSLHLFVHSTTTGRCCPLFNQTFQSIRYDLQSMGLLVHEKKA